MRVPWHGSDAGADNMLGSSGKMFFPILPLPWYLGKWSL